MKEKVKKTGLAGVPAWALSLITFFAPNLLFFIFQSFHLFDYRAIETGFSALYAVFISAACFAICNTHPRSVWYTPVICNTWSIVVAAFYSFFNPTSEILIFMSSVFVLSLIAALVGAKIGRQKLKQKN